MSTRKGKGAKQRPNAAQVDTNAAEDSKFVASRKISKSDRVLQVNYTPWLTCGASSKAPVAPSIDGGGSELNSNVTVAPVPPQPAPSAPVHLARPVLPAVANCEKG